ncbi:MAG: hypothetical protein Q4G59_13115, partial [Planctomycetia bacterium]|nr:hypothetical protein [Planctomycetia bacterium]
GNSAPENSRDANGPPGNGSSDNHSEANNSPATPENPSVVGDPTPDDLAVAKARAAADKSNRSAKKPGLASDEENLSDEERMRRHELKYAPIKKYLYRSTVEFCLELDVNGDTKVTRSEIKKTMPEFGAYFDEWDRNHNGLWEYTEIAFGLYKVRFFTGKESSPASVDSSEGKE